MKMQLKIPLHGKGNAVDKLGLWADMSTLNPKGFRELSDKRNRRRSKKDNPKKIGLNGRFLSRPEQLALELS